MFPLVVISSSLTFATYIIGLLVSKLNGLIYVFSSSYTVNSIDYSNESLTASLSRILDTDMAEEIANYTQLNVLSQARMSILAQANQRPEAILQLLNN